MEPLDLEALIPSWIYSCLEPTLALYEALDGGLWASEPISATMLKSIECLYTFVGVHRVRTQGACC